jgi:rRNA-processing protein FCF1
MKQILLDTNMLMSVGQFKVDIFSELERICDFSYSVAVVDKTVEELEKIKDEQKGRHHAAARLALQLLRRKKVNILKTSSGYADDALAEKSNEGYIVATQDLGLKRRLKKPYLTLRKKKFLMFV